MKCPIKFRSRSHSSTGRCIRICVGEALELFLVHRPEDVLVDGRQANAFPCERPIEILCVQGMFLYSEEKKNEK